MLKLFKIFLVLNLGFIGCAASFGENIIDIDNSVNSGFYQPYPLGNQTIKACCNAQGDGAYCSQFNLNDPLQNISSKIACIFAGVKLPTNYFPANCNMQTNGFCTLQLYPNQPQSIVVYKNVALQVVDNQNIQYYVFDPQGNATGWPNSLTPSLWGFDGNRSANFNRSGNFLNSQLVAASPIDACTQLNNASAVYGKIVLIQRGNCEFGFKGLMAQNAGAIGVIIANNAPGRVFMGAGLNGNSVTIPLAAILQSDGLNLLNLLNQGRVLNVSMGNLVP